MPETTGGTVVVLVSRGSEEPHTPPDERAVSAERERRERGARRYLHETMVASEKPTLRHAPAAGDARTVAACVAISADPGAWFSSASSPLAKRLGSLVRLDDRICMVGGGRIVVLFQGVDPNLHAHVPGRPACPLDLGRTVGFWGQKPASHGRDGRGRPRCRVAPSHERRDQLVQEVGLCGAIRAGTSRN